MSDSAEPQRVQVALCTCPDTDTAKALAESLVDARLAACVNIVPGLLSVYRWQDQVEQEPEVLLVIKTTEARLAALTARIEQEHPYDVPEVISHPIVAGQENYLDWVRQCTAIDE